MAWGLEATLVISGTKDPTADPIFPNLAMGMAVLHKPGSEPGRNGVRALAQVRRRGYRPGWLAADRAYSNAKPEDFQLAVIALGYRPIYDYQINQLGIMTSYQGFLQVDGAWYCPSIPKALAEATVDFRKNEIDEATYEARLAERRNYLARRKGKPDEEGHLRVSCPAANPWPLVRCDLKPASLTPQTTGRMRLQLKADLKANPPPSCSQQSVTIPPEAGAKFGQELLHGSAEWHAAYATLRNTNEGFNGYVKDPSHEASTIRHAADFTESLNRRCSRRCSWRGRISARFEPSSRRRRSLVWAPRLVALGVVAPIRSRSGSHRPVRLLHRRLLIRQPRREVSPNLTE